MDCPGHAGLRTYEVEELPDGTLRFDTEEEAEYPWDMGDVHGVCPCSQGPDRSRWAI